MLTVVGVPERPEIKVAGVEPGHVHGEIVGLGAAVDEVDVLERLGEEGGQPLGVLVDLGVHVDVGGVPEGVDLVVQGLVDLGVAVTHADRHDPAKQVQVSAKCTRER